MTAITALVRRCSTSVARVRTAPLAVLDFEEATVAATGALARVGTAAVVAVVTEAGSDGSEARTACVVAPQALPVGWVLSRLLMIASMRDPAPIGPGG